MRRFLSLAALLLLAAPFVRAASMPELFQKAKEQFKLGNYTQALAAVEALDAESVKPGNEAERLKILPGLLFYRGASLAALGRSDEAEQAFEGFLARTPNASIDPGLYPPRVVAAFDAARKSLEATASKPNAPAQTGVLADAYRAFRPPESKPDEERDWARGPAKYLLTPAEKEDFERLTDLLERSEFIANFWKSRDPKPETPENEFREEFERRVAFSDARFTQDETRGSLTDRGMVFILVGAPTYNGQRPLYASDEAGAADAAGQSRYSNAEVTMAQHAGGSSANKAAAVDRVTNPSATMNRSGSNWIESWTYLRAELPKAIPYQELKVQFVTKDGYGKNVLQREPNVVTAIERVKKADSRAGS
ncbi:MAG TPA: GWxTD domain-containing protein [Thermoanaerobaculia bacterium]|nr:GWxTD domain-containing protein [Thermoanaerobaculia bacterium]